MGLLDKIKKKKPEDKEKSDTEMIGGLLADSPPPLSDLIEESYPTGLPGSDEPFTQGFTENAGVPEAEERRNEDITTSMDIFTQETAADDDGFNLANQLPDIDVYELLAECRDVATKLKERKRQGS